jgi:hypothetical protein
VLGHRVHATMAKLTTTACIDFFTDLIILSNLLSIYMFFIFMHVVVAQLVRPYLISSKW